MSEITRLLELVGTGDCDAEEQLLRLVHDELKRIATARMSSERAGHTLQTTALVNEAYMRLMGKNAAAKKVDSSEVEHDSNQTSFVQWNSRGHFFSAAAEAMRRILIDNARRKKRQKRGGNNKQVPMHDIEFQVETSEIDLVLLDQALTRLEASNAEHAAVVKLRYFAGMTIEQTAEALEVSASTVKRSWAFARAWLRREIGE